MRRVRKDEYDARLKEVQAFLIAACCGDVLRVRESKSVGGGFYSAEWLNADGRPVFRQLFPFSDLSSYFVDDRLVTRILFSDPTR